MYLKKFDFIQNNKNNKLSFRNLHPFSAFKTSKIKNDFLKQINKYEEKENNCMSLFGIDISNINKNNDKNKRSDNSSEKSMNSSLSKSLKNILLLKNPNKKNSLPINNQIIFNFDLFPHIQRKVKKFKTNLSINTNNINNKQINNLILTNLFETKTKKDLNKLNKSNFITDIMENKSNNFNYISNSEKNIFKINRLLNPKKRKNNIELNQSSNFNNQFSYNELTSINNNTQKTLNFKRTFLFNNKVGKNNFSIKFVNNMKSLSILKCPLNKRKKSNIFHSFSANKFFTYKDNSSKKARNKNNYLSLKSNLSLSEEMKSSLDKKKTNHKKVFNKTYNKHFNVMIKNNLFDLEEGINKESKEQEKTEDEYKSYIKYMIKKCKYIYNILDKNISIKIPESDYIIKKEEKIESIHSKTHNKNSKNSELSKLKNKLKENEHKIFR